MSAELRARLAAVAAEIEAGGGEPTFIWEVSRADGELVYALAEYARKAEAGRWNSGEYGALDWIGGEAYRATHPTQPSMVEAAIALLNSHGYTVTKGH